MPLADATASLSVSSRYWCVCGAQVAAPNQATASGELLHRKLHKVLLEAEELRPRRSASSLISFSGRSDVQAAYALDYLPDISLLLLLLLLLPVR